MILAQISKGGQISIPAKIRQRWQTRQLLLEDHGDEIILRPGPEDPIAAAAGSLADSAMTSQQLRERTRADDAELDKHQRIKAAA